MKTYTLKEKTIIGFILSFFIIFTIFFYGPLGVYLSNEEEFSFGLGAVIKGVAIVSIIILMLLIVISVIIPQKVFIWYAIFLLGIGIGFYVQGNLFKNNYGVLDGTEIKWAKYAKYGFLNTIVWIVIIFLPLIIYVIIRKKIKDNVGKYVSAICIFLILIQMVSFVAQLLSYNRKEAASLIITNNQMFTFAPANNIVVFMIDTVDEEYYQAFRDNHSEFEDKLDGFTRYDNAMTGGARTMMAMPIFFTGVPFDRQETYSDYIKDIYKNDNLIEKMYDAGYDVRIYSEPMFYSNDTIDYVSNFVSDAEPITSESILTRKLYKLCMFRFFPHILKRFFWMDTAEFDEAIVRIDNYMFDDSDYYEYFKKHKITIDRSLNKTFTVYHLRGIHRPYDMDKNANKVVSVDRDEQMEGVFKIVGEVIDELKKTNLYNSTDILITADHGDLRECQWIMMFHKAAGKKGKMKLSHAPVSSFDFPVYYSELIGNPLSNQIYGMNFTALKEDEVRTRYLYRNASDNSKLVVNKFRTDSTAGDYNAFILDIEYVENVEDSLYKMGDRLGFDVDNTGNKYAVEGFSENHGFRTKLKGPVSRLVIPFEKEPEKNVIVNIELHERSVVGTGMMCIIRANDTEVYSHIVDEKMINEGISFELDKSTFTDNNLTIEFHFPELSVYEMDNDVVERTTTISIVSIVINEVD